MLSRLRKLPIRTIHLEETGVGRTVNGLKKLGDKVGDNAKDLVSHWKYMVVQEEQAAAERAANGKWPYFLLIHKLIHEYFRMCDLA